MGGKKKKTMASSSRTIPHLLEPYLLRTEPADDNNSYDADSNSISEPELVIATSVLGASTNWLILRYLYSFLKQTSQPEKTRIVDQGDQLERRIPATAASVVLVSFLRDFAFWKENAGRIGLDLDALARAGRFGYVDGLGVDLFHSEERMGAAGGNNPRGLSSSLAAGIGRLPAAPPSPIAPGRQPRGAGAIPLRGGPALPQGPAPVLGAGGVGVGAGAGAGASSLTNPRISHLRSVISSTIEKVGSGAANSSERKPSNKVILIIDQLDFLLAASSGGSGTTGDDDKVSPQALRDLLLDLREVHRSCLASFNPPVFVSHTFPISYLPYPIHTKPRFYFTLLYLSQS